MLAELKSKSAVLGSMVMGHQSGVIDGLRTDAELWRRRRSVGAPPAPATAEARRLRRNGFLATEPRYSPELISRVQEGLAFAELPATSVAMGGRIKDSVRYVTDPLCHVPALAELLTDDVATVVRAWYGTEFRVTTVRMWRIAHIPEAASGEHHYGNLWHVDGHRLDILKLFVQVTPGVDEQGSAFRLLPRRETRRAFHLGFRDQADPGSAIRRLFDERIELFDGPPGSAMFVDTDRCLHRAGNPIAGTTRGMVQFMFAPDPGGPERAAAEYLDAVPADTNVHEGSVA